MKFFVLIWREPRYLSKKWSLQDDSYENNIWIMVTIHSMSQMLFCISMAISKRKMFTRSLPRYEKKKIRPFSRRNAMYTRQDRIHQFHRPLPKIRVVYNTIIKNKNTLIYLSQTDLSITLKEAIYQLAK